MKAIAILENHGVVYFEQTHSDQPVKITFDLKGFSSKSTHAIHIHEFGDMSEGCKSLGAHFNPTNKKHFHSENGHSGDLINNFTTDVHGLFRYTYFTRELSLFPSKANILGRSVVVHQFPDDYGLGGVVHNNQLIPYQDLSTDYLHKICQTLGYPQKTRSDMIRKLRSESETTGNASTRIDGAIIAVAKS